MKKRFKTWYQLVWVAVLSLMVLLAGAEAQAGFIDPLGGVTIAGLIIRITNWLIGLVALLAMLSLVVGGIKFILAFGSEDKLRSAKTIIFWSVAGLAVVILGYVIIRQVATILGAT